MIIFWESSKHAMLWRGTHNSFFAQRHAVAEKLSFLVNRIHIDLKPEVQTLYWPVSFSSRSIEEYS